jgi:hypothetical protein
MQTRARSSARAVLFACALLPSAASAQGVPLASPPTSTTSGTLERSPLSLTGYVQLDYARYDRSSDQLSDGNGQPLNEDRFFLRDARVKLIGDWEYVGFAAQAELSTNNGPAFGIRLVEGVVKYPGEPGQPPLIRLSAGNIPIPFTYENHLLGNEQRFFGERALLIDALLPGRFDLGVSLSGAYRFLRWAIAVQNGEPMGERSFPGRDPNGAKDLSGRLGIDAEIIEGVRLSGAISALTGSGFSPGRVPTKDNFVWRDFNEDGVVSPSELVVVKGAAGRPSESFDRWGVGIDLQLRFELPVVGQLLAYGEAVTAVNLDRSVAPADPILVGRDQRSRGFYAALVQELGDHFMAGARFDLYEPNLDSTELEGGETVISRRTFTTWTFSVAALLPLEAGPRARLLAELVKQGNSLGRDASGRPAQLENDAVRFRLEVTF